MKLNMLFSNVRHDSQRWFIDPPIGNPKNDLCLDRKSLYGCPELVLVYWLIHEVNGLSCFFHWFIGWERVVAALINLRRRCCGWWAFCLTWAALQDLRTSDRDYATFPGFVPGFVGW